jgi:hypothetical protein
MNRAVGVNISFPLWKVELIEREAARGDQSVSAFVNEAVDAKLGHGIEKEESNET